MATLNKVMLIGNITRDPELRQAGGTSVCGLGLALSRKYKSKDGEQKEETCFVDVTAWGRTAELIVQYCAKGDPLMVEGRLKLDQWEKDGQKRSKISVTAENVQFLGNRQKPDRNQQQDQSGEEDQRIHPDRNQAPAGSDDDHDDLPF